MTEMIIKSPSDATTNSKGTIIDKRYTDTSGGLD